MQIFTPVIRTDLQAHAQGLRPWLLEIPGCWRSLAAGDPWLLEIAVWLVAAIGLREECIALSRHRVAARRELRELMFLMMCLRMRFRKSERLRCWMRPPSTPAGFR